MTMSPPDNQRSQARRTSDMQHYDRWACGGKPGIHSLDGVPGVWYCGDMKVVPSMAEDCEVLHERGLHGG